MLKFIKKNVTLKIKKTIIIEHIVRFNRGVGGVLHQSLLLKVFI